MLTPLALAGHGNAEFERDDATKLAEGAAGRRLSPGRFSIAGWSADKRRPYI